MEPELVILGRGRIGTFMFDLASRAGTHAVLLGRDDDAEPVGASHPGRAILVATRNDDLEGIIADVHPDNLPHLVFIQNGLLGPWLEERGLADCTQGVLYVAVPTVGAPAKAGGESLFWGRHAARIAAMMKTGGIPARSTPDQEVFLRETGIKMLWICIFGLLGQATGKSVGELARDEKVAVGVLASELAPVLCHVLDVSLPIGPVTQEILRYARAIPDYRSGLREWDWRNGVLVAAAAEAGLLLPHHSTWLARTKT